MSIAKFGKKFLCLIALFAIFAVAVSCGQQRPADPAKTAITEKVDDIYDKLYWDTSAMVDITKTELTLLTETKYEDVTISWTSSVPTVIKDNGEVIRPVYTHEKATLVNPSDPEDTSKHVEVTLIATIKGTYGNGEEVIRNKEFKFTVLCLDENLDFGTIADVKARAYQYIYEEKGVAKALSSDSNTTYSAGFYGIVTTVLAADGSGQFMVHDGTEGIYVYNALKGVKAGDTVLVYGDIYSYYGSLQVGSNISAYIMEPGTPGVPEMTVPAYTEMSVESWENDHAEDFGYFGGKLYSIYAKLVAEKSTATSDEFKLVDPYTGDVAWIYYKSYNTEQKAILTSYDGKYVNITGVSYDRDSRLVKNHLLWDGGIEEAAAPTLTDAQKADQVKAVIETLAGSYASGLTLALPTENAEYGATIAWNIPADAPYKNGTFEIVDKDTEFTAVATITVGEVAVNVDVKITVNPIVKVTVEEAATKEKDAVVKLEGTIEAVFGSKGYYYLKDATGNILVYVQTSNGITVNGETVTVKAGDKISLIGKVGYYNGTPQIASVVKYESHEAATWTIDKPTAATWEEVLAYTKETAPYGQYTMLEGYIKADGSYFLLAQSTAEDAKTIALYNSNVPEKVKAVVGQDVKVTLFAYYYGNAKSDYSGAIRFVLAGRDGESFVGDETVVIPETKDPMIYEPVAETEYVFGLYQGTLAKDLYFAGTMSGSFIATTEKASEAVKVKLEAVEGGYRVYFMDGETKKYIDIYEYTSGKVGVRLTDTPSAVFTYNTELNTVVATVLENDYYLGTYNNFATISASKTSYAATSFVSHFFDASKLPADPIVTPDPDPDPEPTTTPIDDAIVKSVAAETEYVFGLYQGTLAKSLYFAGTMSGNFIATTEKASEAVKVKLEAVEGGYRVYFMEGEAKKYIDIYEYTSGKVGVRLTDAPSAVFTYNTELNTVVATVLENDYYLGTYNNFATISASKTSYAATSFVSHFLDASKLPADPIVTPDPDPDPDPTPEGTVAKFDFGKLNITGFAKEKAINGKVVNIVDNKTVDIIAHYSQIVDSTYAPHAEDNSFVVLCPVRKNNETKLSYVQFSFAEAVNSVKFDGAWWSAGDSNNASKITEFYVEYSADGTTWTKVSLGAVSAISATKYQEYTATVTGAKFVRICATGDAVYTSHQSARICVDNIEFVK